MLRAAVIALVVAAAPAPAHADVGVVVVAATSAPADDAAVSAAIGDGLAHAGESARPDAAAAADAAASAGAVPASQLGAFARVRELTDEGWHAYLQVQTEFALARLGEARRQAESVVALDGGLAAYADAALRLGAALDNVGQHGEADEVLRLAAALDPTRVVSALEFSPDVVAAYQRAVAAKVGTRRMRVTVKDAPAGASVEIDGAAAVPAPAEVDVAIGEHVVVARAPGMVARGETVEVAAPGTESGAVGEEIALDPDPAAALADRPVAGQSEPAAAAWVDAAVTYADLDAIVLASSVWRGGKPALLAQWCDGAPTTCTAVIEIGYEDGGLTAAGRAAIEGLAKARRGSAHRYAPTLPGDPRLARGGKPRGGPAVVGGGRHCRWCRPALYAGGGLAAVLVTVGVVAIATAGSSGTVVGIDPADFGL